MGQDTFADRLKHVAFREACLKHEVEAVEYPCSGSITEARALGRLLARESGRPRSFIICSDYIAAGFIRGLADEGISIPEDAAVVGVDGTAMGEFSTPALTTIAQDCPQLMVRSIELLLKKNENKDMPAKEIFLPTQLIVRESA